MVLLVALSPWASAQYVVKDSEELANLERLPQEKVYLHHTGPVVLAGEYVHYSFYCFNAQSNRPSNISYIGYVALVNEEREMVLEQKVRLSKGQSQGDFFINTDIPSGNYKLLGYTQWMKNNGLEQVFKDDFVVINPYQVDQGKLLKDGRAVAVNEGTAVMEKPMYSSIIQISLDREVYAPREKVSFGLRNYKGQLGHGSYTVKVQKKSAIPSQPALNAMAYGKSYFGVDGKIGKQVGDSLYLPEQRGELLYGTVTDKASGDKMEDANVVISLPGEEFILKFASTDSSGNFYTYVKKEYKEPSAIVQIDGTDKEVGVTLKKASALDLSQLTFDHFYLSADYAGAIEKRSVYNQLDNQFFSTKPDSVLLGTPIDPFDGGMPETLELDEYTRFSTFGETLVELFSFAGYRRDKEGREYIRIAQDFETYDEAYNDFPAIVLVDGVYIPEPGKIKDFDARKIKNISLIRDQFRLGGKDYQGMLVARTFDGDFYETYAPEHGINTSIASPIPKKNYYVQRYLTEDVSFRHIPDYRSLLLWEPHVDLEEGDLNFEFFTSDLQGEYEVVLDGFTTYGKPISVYKTITVNSKAVE